MRLGVQTQKRGSVGDTRRSPWGGSERQAARRGREPVLAQETDARVLPGTRSPCDSSQSVLPHAEAAPKGSCGSCSFG